jgi:hypothetical protein
MGKNEINTWAQGFFVDGPLYRTWTTQEKRNANEREQLLVRPYPTSNAICRCDLPENAAWIAERLNKASNADKQIAELNNKTIELKQSLKTANDIINICTETKKQYADQIAELERLIIDIYSDFDLSEIKTQPVSIQNAWNKVQKIYPQRYPRNRS